jgi:RNA polymerase sigma-70 factor, ECF subfamily
MTNTTFTMKKELRIPDLILRVIQLFSRPDPSTGLDPEIEKVLVEKAVHDPQAFEDLYRSYVNRVYAFHLVRTGSREEAEDLTSQTFLSALEGLAKFRSQGSFSAWLFTIARRKLIDHYRRPSTLPIELAEDVTGSLEESVDHKLRLQQVNQALLGIDRDRVEALSLRIFGQLSAAETGEILSKSEGAVRNLVYRALQDLRRQLTPEAFVEEK